jgi:hypothetical protein
MRPLGKLKATVIKIKKNSVRIRLVDDSELDIPTKFFKIFDIKVNQEVYYQLVEQKDGTFQQELVEIESNKLSNEQIKEIHDSK